MSEAATQPKSEKADKAAAKAASMSASAPVSAPVRTPVAAAGAASLPTRREQKLREAQQRKFVGSALQPMGYGTFDRLTVAVPGDWSVADCLDPGAWSNVAGLVAEDALKTRANKIGSVIEIHHPRFYAEAVIREVVRDQFGGPCGLKVALTGPAQDPGSGAARARDLETGLPWSDPEADPGIGGGA